MDTLPSTELMYGVKCPNVLDKSMPIFQGLEQEGEDTAVKLDAARVKVRQKAVAREQ
jgi:hypothetical protein